MTTNQKLAIRLGASAIAVTLLIMGIYYYWPKANELPKGTPPEPRPPVATSVKRVKKPTPPISAPVPAPAVRNDINICTPPVQPPTPAPAVIPQVVSPPAPASVPVPSIVNTINIYPAPTPTPTPPTAAVQQPLLIVGGYDPQIHGYILPLDPCGFTRFPYIANPRHWFSGYMIQCRNQRTGALYDKWVPDHYE